MSHRWSVAHSLKGSWVYLYDYDWRARAWEALDGKVCACRLPEWVWQIPTGRRRRDEDGFLENSIASRVWDVEQWFSLKASRAADRCQIATIDISQAQLLELAPDWAFLFEDDAA